MRYGRTVERIVQNCEAYKKSIDAAAEEFATRKQIARKELQAARASGNFSQKYLAELEQKPIAIADIEKKVEQARRVYANESLQLMKTLNERLGQYFNAPVSSNILNRLQVLNLTNGTMTEREGRLILSECRSYADLQAISDYLASKAAELPIRSQISIPDIERSMSDFEQAEAELKRLFEGYCGANAELMQILLPGEAEAAPEKIMLASTADSFIRNGYAERLTRLFSELSDCLPNGTKYEPLTENEIVFLKSIIPSEYDWKIKESIAELQKWESLPQAEAILALLERSEFAEYVKD